MAHYSGKIVNNSSLHFGVYWKDRLEGVMSFGCPMDKRRMLSTVEGTKWNDMLELNRMAFSESLPRNSESRALSVAFRLIKKHYKNIQWVVSFADATQCGDGTIYRASGFDLIGIKKNEQILNWNGSLVSKKTLDSKNYPKINGRYYSSVLIERGEAYSIEGFQLKYIYFIDKSAKDRLTAPIIPFSKISEIGASMYKGEKITRRLSEERRSPSADGGAIPTPTLQTSAL